MKYHITLQRTFTLQKEIFLQKDGLSAEDQKEQINAERLSAEFLQKLSAEILQKGLSGRPLPYTPTEGRNIKRRSKITLF